jgi:ADP-heptose:LPS heptosyltransferase
MSNKMPDIEVRLPSLTFMPDIEVTSRSDAKMRKILVLAEGQLGDLLLLTPALKAIKSGIPGSRLTVLIYQRRGTVPAKTVDTAPVAKADPSGTAAVLLGNPAVDEVVEVHRAQMKSLSLVRRIRAELGIIWWLRGQRFDSVLCTFPEDRFALTAYLSGAKTRVGQRQQGLAWLLNNRPDIQKNEGGVLLYYCNLARALGGNVISEHTEFPLIPDATNWAASSLVSATNGRKSIVLMHPGASGDYKIWPPEYFAALADRLLDRGIAVVLCGGEGDEDVVIEVGARAKHVVPLFKTEGNLQHLGALFAQSALVVSNDSGPRHLGIAVGARTLALFRQHHDREWSVYAESPQCRILRGRDQCPACPAGKCTDCLPPGERFGSYCMRMISVDEAAAAALEMLSAS